MAPTKIWNHALLNRVISIKDVASANTNPLCNNNPTKVTSTTPNPPGTKEMRPRTLAAYTNTTEFKNPKSTPKDKKPKKIATPSIKMAAIPTKNPKINGL